MQRRPTAVFLYASEVESSAKTTLLVAVPLIFQLLFVGYLYSALSDIETQAEKIEESRVIVTHMNRFLRATMDLVGASRMETLTGRKLDHRELIGEMEKELDILTKLSADKPEYSTLLARLRSDLYEGKTQAERVRALIRSGDFAGARLAAKDVKGLLNDFAANYQEVRELQEKIEDTMPNVSLKRRELIKNALILGISLNILLSVSLAIIIQRGLVTRLMILNDNANLLKSNQELKPAASSSSDEIAHLDRTFREMAATISRAREYEKQETDRLKQILKEREELEQLKQQFVAVVSHDLRTPLSAVQNYLEMVGNSMYGDLNETGRERLLGVQSHVERLIKLTKDLLDAERLDSGTMKMEIKDISLVNVIRQSLDAVASVAEAAGVSIVTPSDQEDVAVRADQDRIVQVLVNLLSNAIKFSPRGGTVEIAVSKLESQARIQVRDQGPGIPEGFEERIFDRFQQVSIEDSKKRGGAGLGLAICKSIINQHNGEIGVNSELGKGSSFWFTLSLVD